MPMKNHCKTRQTVSSVQVRFRNCGSGGLGRRNDVMILVACWPKANNYLVSKLNVGLDHGPLRGSMIKDLGNSDLHSDLVFSHEAKACLGNRESPDHVAAASAGSDCGGKATVEHTQVMIQCILATFF